MNKDNLQTITLLRHTLHRNPELSMKEKGTARLLTEFFKQHITSFTIVKREGWFYAVKEGTDPDAAPVAFRAEMDALPMSESIQLAYGSLCEGVAHKCGHDGHMAVLCGLAMELDPVPVRRSVYLIFQPAEETGAGAKRCAALIEEKGIKEVYAFHNRDGYPEGALIYRKGLTQPASQGLEIRLTGRPSHASDPETGINPAAAVGKILVYAEEFRKKEYHGMTLVTTVGAKVGTGDYGISAGEGSVQLTIRAEQERDLTEVTSLIQVFTNAVAREYGLTVEYGIFDYFPETRNSDEGISRLLACAGKLGMETIEMKEIWRSSEDFGHFLKKCSGAMFYIGNGEASPALHTLEYDFNDRIIAPAVDLFLELAQ